MAVDRKKLDSQASSKRSMESKEDQSQALQNTIPTNPSERGSSHNVSQQEEELVTKEDIDSIFEDARMPSLMLTKMKVKKSKQAIQDALSVNNHNMAIIDRNVKDLLFLVKDLI